MFTALSQGATHRRAASRWAGTVPERLPEAHRSETPAQVIVIGARGRSLAITSARGRTWEARARGGGAADRTAGRPGGRHAAEALGELGDARALEPLIALLKHIIRDKKNMNSHREALEALDRFGEARFWAVRLAAGHTVPGAAITNLTTLLRHEREVQGDPKRASEERPQIAPGVLRALADLQCAAVWRTESGYQTGCAGPRRGAPDGSLNRLVGSPTGRSAGLDPPWLTRPECVRLSSVNAFVRETVEGDGDSRVSLP